MSTKIEKEFVFETAIHFEDKFMINFFEMTLLMQVETESLREQQVAMDRINYFLSTYVENAIFVNAKEKKAIDNYEKAGMRVLTLPEDPYDQIVGLILMRKLNSITEDRLKITDMVFGSKLTAGIKFHSTVEESEDFEGKNWWDDSTTCVREEGKPISKKDKVVKLFSQKDEWAEVGLLWKDPEANNN